MSKTSRVEEIVEEFEKRFPYQLIPRSFSATKKFNPEALHFDHSEDIKNWLRTALTQHEDGLLEKLLEIEKDRWNDAHHCTCLAHAILVLAGGEDSEKGKEMRDRLKGKEE